MKIVYFGSSTSLSLIPLKSLLESQYTLSAIVVNEKTSSSFNVITPGTISSLAFNNSITVLNYDNKNIELEVAVINPDLVIVSCFSKRIPTSILSHAKFGGINIHPSLLPLYRGPDPLFWQFRDGENDFGITIHQLTGEFDAGDIVSQKKVKLVDGIAVEQASEELAKNAADLLLLTLRGIEDCNFTKVKQNQELSSYQSFAKKNDYAVSTSWKAIRIYNFISAYKAENVSFECDIYGRRVKLINAVSYQDTPYPEMRGEKVTYNNNRVVFACKNGYIECEYKD